MAMIKCENCGKEISDKSVKCVHCGLKVHEKIKCNECGKLIDKDSKSCPNCGCPIKKKTKKIYIIIISIILLILIIGLFIGINFVNKEKKIFNNNLKEVVDKINEGVSLSNECGLLIKNTLYNNTLNNLLLNTEYNNKVNLIKNNQNEVNNLMKKINNPLDLFEDELDELEDYYDEYLEFSNLVINPRSNLVMFNRNFDEEYNDVMSEYNKLMRYIK